MRTYPDSDRALDDALTVAGRHGTAETVCQAVTLSRDWRSPPDTLRLEARYRIHHDAFGHRVEARLGRHELYLDEPVRLAPASVEKPWGREIWHTGIEARGESRVLTPQGELPLSQYLALAPRRLCGLAPLLLLKVLDPSPRAVLGDLYFEVHRHKREVYVVTHVDREAWPAGRGGIRYGMNQALRGSYGDDDAFRRDYLAAVKAYEAVRRAIDAGEPMPAEREAELRAAMERFTHLRELAVGDVVVVPPWLPHSLQHGVRVIEFQTPTYERYVISFAQQVLTQEHWDSETAVAGMRLDVPPDPQFEDIGDGVERIVAFDHFRVWRAHLPPGGHLVPPGHPSYLVCIAVHGQVRLGSLVLEPEQAAFVPASALTDARRHRHARLTNPGERAATVLLAAPDL